LGNHQINLPLPDTKEIKPQLPARTFSVGRFLIALLISPGVVFALLNLAVYIFSNYYLARIVQRGIKSAATLAVTDSLYKFEIDSVSIGITTGRIQFFGISYAPTVSDSVFMNALPLRKNRIKFSVSEIDVQGIDWRRAFLNSDYRATVLMLREPVLDVMTRPLPDTLAAKPDTGRKSFSLPNNLKLSLDSLVLVSPKATYSTMAETVDSIFVAADRLSLNDIHADSVKRLIPALPIRLASIESIGLSATESSSAVRLGVGRVFVSATDTSLMVSNLLVATDTISTLGIESLSASAADSTLAIRNVRYAPTLPLADYFVAYPRNSSYLEAETESILASSVDFRRVIQTASELNLQSLRIQTPKVTVSNRTTTNPVAIKAANVVRSKSSKAKKPSTRPKNRPSKSAKPLKTARQKKSVKLPKSKLVKPSAKVAAAPFQFLLQTLTIDKPQVKSVLLDDKLKAKSSTTYSLAALTVTGISTLPEKFSAKRKSVPVGGLAIGFENAVLDTFLLASSPTGIYKFSIDQIAFPAQSIDIKNFAYVPTLSDDALYEKSSSRFDRYRITIPNISATSNNWNETFRHLTEAGGLRLSGLAVNNLSLNVLADKRRPAVKSTSLPKMPNDALRNLPFKFSVDNLTMKDANVIYSERAAGSLTAGNILFNNLSASFHNLSNEAGRMSDANPLTLKMHGLFMKKGMLDLSLKMNLISQGLTLKLKGDVTNMPATAVNEFIVPNERIEVLDGFVEKGSFDFGISNGTVFGVVIPVYRDLRLKKLATNPNETDGLGEGLISFLANNFKIRLNNTGKSPKQGTVSGRQRKPDEAFLEFLWLSLRQGLGEVVGF
jgi:hypothetical protein